MDIAQIEKLRNINSDIIKCAYCDFHKYLPQEFYFKPDAPIYDYDDASIREQDYRVMALGINPGWNSRYECPEWQDIYKHPSTDYAGYEKKVLQQATNDKETNNTSNPYANGIAKAMNVIMEELKEYYHEESIRNELNIGPLDITNIYNQVFWTNLSFCNSQKPGVRVFQKQTIPCNTYTEEIPNCLDKGFVKNIIRTIEPKLLIFFNSYLYHKVLLKQLLEVDYSNIKSSVPITVIAYEKKQQQIMTNFYCAKITDIKDINKELFAIFLHHPSARITEKGKREGIKQICNWLFKNEFVT